MSVDPDLPGAELTARVMLTTLRRLPGQIYLDRQGLSAGSIDRFAAEVAAIDPEHPLQIAAVSDPTVRLHIGCGRGDEAIRIVPEGHGAHIAGLRSAVIRPRRTPSGLGCVYSSALGVDEAFKYTAQVIGPRRTLHRHLRFCPVTLSTDLSRAPSISEALELNLALVGVGAIGTAVILILSELDAFGVLLAVDNQTFDRENLGTYSLGGVAEVADQVLKVELARALTRFTVIPFEEKVECLPEAIDGGMAPWLPLVLNGLDSPEARRAAQLLWPDRMIDGATGDTVLGISEYVDGAGPCMLCLFPVERTGPSGAERLAARLGLPLELLARGDTILREEHLGGLTDTQRADLIPHLGKPVCGLASAVGLTNLDAGDYRPSVPFISQQSACLMVGRAIARSLQVGVPGNFVQYDGLIGPQRANIDQLRTAPGCYCETRATTIAAVRNERRSRAIHFHPPANGVAPLERGGATGGR